MTSSARARIDGGSLRSFRTKAAAKALVDEDRDRLADAIAEDHRCPRNITAGPVYTGNEAKRHGIRTDGEENDWNGGRFTLCCHRRPVVGGEDRRHLSADKFSCQFKQPIQPWWPAAVFYCQVLAFDISGFF